MIHNHNHRSSYYTLSGVEFEGEDVANFEKGHNMSKRLDEEIREEASEILKNHENIDATDINIRVEEGFIFLNGAVGSRDIRCVAEDCLKDITGVHEVVNKLTIKDTTSVKDLQGKISRNLQRDEELRKQKMG
jgi:hypothetical protein